MTDTTITPADEGISVAQGNGEKRPAAPVRHVSADDRAARGKAARGAVPRSGHAVWEAPADRPDPIGILEAQATSRVADLVPIRYGRMVSSPFAFYRGAAAIMASDLATTPRSGIKVQTCGDAHVSNFGLFGSPERELVFDINDFDETLPGPWEWDVKRLAASLTIAGRGNGFSAKRRREVVLRATAGYRTAMREFAGMRNLDVWYAHARVQEGLPRLRAMLDEKSLKEAERLVGKARTKDSMQAFEKLTHVVDGERRIISTPPLIVPVEELFAEEVVKPLYESLHSLVRTTAGACWETGGTCSRASVFRTSHGRWSAWAASAPARGSC